MEIARLQIAVDSTSAKGAARDLDALTGKANQVTGAVKSLAAAFGVYKAAAAVKDMALLSARYETLGVVMNVVGRNAGYTFSQMGKLQEGLERTGISMIESRNTLATMAQAHIDLAKSTGLARLAQDAAVIGNINSSEAFQRMIYGIQSGQTDVLRTIGLNVNFEQSYAKLSAQLGKSTKDLTEAEKTTARMNAVLAKAPDLAGAYEASMGTAGKQILSMKRYTEDLQVILGATFTPALGVAVQAINQSFKDAKDFIKENREEFTGLSIALKDAMKQYVGLSEAIKSAFGGQGGNILTVISVGIRLTAFNIALISDAIKGAVTGMYAFVGVAAKVQSMIPSGMRKYLGMGTDTEIANAMVWSGAGMNKMANQGSSVEAWLKSINQSNQKPYQEKNRSWMHMDYAGGGTSGGGVDGGPGSGVFSGDMDSAVKWFDDNERKTKDWLDEVGTMRIDAEQNVSEIIQRQYEVEAENIRRINTGLFGDMLYTLNNWSMQSTDAFVDFCFEGKNAFSDLIQSMLKDLAKLAVQKNVMDPIFGYIGKAITNWGTGGTTESSFDVMPGYATGTNYVPQDGPAYLHRGEAVIPAAQNRGQTNNVSISVTVNGNGQVQTDVKTGGQNALALGQMMKSMALQVIQEQQRPNGLLAGA